MRCISCRVGWLQHTVGGGVCEKNRGNASEASHRLNCSRKEGLLRDGSAINSSLDSLQSRGVGRGGGGGGMRGGGIWCGIDVLRSETSSVLRVEGVPCCGNAWGGMLGVELVVARVLRANGEKISEREKEDFI